MTLVGVDERIDDVSIHLSYFVVDRALPRNCVT